MDGGKSATSGRDDNVWEGKKTITLTVKML
jgi:hypothetical protein